MSFCGLLPAVITLIAASALPPVRADEPVPSSRIVARLGSGGLRHGEPINCVAWSPDGKLLASGGQDGSARVWDPATGMERCAFAMGYPVSALDFSPDGKTLAVAIETHPLDGASLVALWDLTTGRLIRRLASADRRRVHSLAFSRDGKAIATGGIGGRVHLWDSATGNEIRALSAGEGTVRRVAFAPDGKLLAAAGEGQRIYLFDPATGKEIKTLTGHVGDVYQLCFSPDGKRLASGDSLDTSVRLWDVDTGKGERFWQGGAGYIGSLAFSKDGKQLAFSQSSYHSILVYEIANKKRLHNLLGHDDTIRGAAFDPNGKLLASCGGEGRLRLWDLATGKQHDPYGGHLRVVQAVVFSPDGKTIATGSPDCTARLWNAATGVELRSFEWPNHYWIGSVGFTPDGKHLVVGGHNMIKRWDIASGKALPDLTGQEGIALGMAFSPDGKRMATLANGGTIAIWKLDDNRLVSQEVYHPYGIRGMEFLADGRLMVAIQQDRKQVRVEWPAGKNELKPPPRIDGGSILPFSPDGRTCAEIDRRSTISLLEMASGNSRLRLMGHRGDVVSQAFSPDGRLLVTGSKDCTAIVWDVTGRRKNGVLEAVKLTDAERDRAWLQLSNNPAAVAYEGLWTLVAAGDAIVPFVKSQLLSTGSTHVARLIAQLDDKKFAIRQQASKELLDLGAIARAPLEQALKANLSPEARRRIMEILEKLPREASYSPEVRDVRAVELLEQIGTAEARKLLEELSRSPADLRLTIEAGESLKRLAGRR